MVFKESDFGNGVDMEIPNMYSNQNRKKNIQYKNK
jgi:hypothetical protein